MTRQEFTNYCIPNVCVYLIFKFNSSPVKLNIMTSRRSFLKTSAGFAAMFPVLNLQSFDFLFNNRKDEQDISFFDTLLAEEESDEALYLYGYNRTIGEDLVINKNLFIVCDTFHLDSIITTNGHSVSILCRKFTATSKAFINTNGKSYTLSDSPPKATTPNGDLGTQGNDGDKALSLAGGAAGPVTIRTQILANDLKISAEGGDGRKGQDGGDSMAGKKGADGGLEQNGGQGQKGPNGGKGADGGDGGNGGVISIYLCDNSFEVKILPGSAFDSTSTYSLMSKAGKVTCLIQSNGGQPGIGGNGGAGGSGGQGGNGGTHIIKIRNHPDRTWDNKTIPNYFPVGITGDNGQIGGKGSSGREGRWVSPSIKQTTHKDIAEQINGFEILATIIDIKLDECYIKNSYQELSDLLKWYGNVLQSKKVSELTLKWNSVSTKIKAYSTRLSLNLDFWGNASGYVSLLNIKTINTDLNSYFDNAVEFEKSYSDFINAKATASAKAAAARQAVTMAKTYLADKQAKVVSLRDDCNALNQQIFQMSNDILTLEKQLTNDETAFRLAIEKEVGCNLQNTLQFVKMAISIGRAMEGDVSGIISALSEANDVFSKNLDPVFEKNVVKKAKVLINSGTTIVDQIQDLKQQYQTLKDLMNPNEDLYAIPEGDYKALLDKYGDLKEAQSLKTDFANYNMLCNNRNQNRLKLSEKLIDYIKSSAEILTLQADMADKSVRSLLAESKITSPAAKIFMDNLYYRVRLDALNLLYIEYKAFNYWSLKNEAPGNPEVKSLQVLQTEHNNVHRQIITHLNSRNRGRHKADQEDAFVLNKSTHPLEFERFLKTQDNANVLVFTINPQQTAFNLKDNCEIYADTVRVRLENVTSKDNELRIKIVHMGNPIFFNYQNQKVEYTHGQTGASMTWDIQSKQFKVQKIERNLTDEDDDYLGVSPFASWRLVLQNDGSVDLSKLTEIKIGFGYTYVAII